MHQGEVSDALSVSRRLAQGYSGVLFSLHVCHLWAVCLHFSVKNLYFCSLKLVIDEHYMDCDAYSHCVDVPFGH